MLLSNREGKGSFHSNLSNLLNVLFPAMIEQGSHNPYPITARSPHAMPLPIFGSSDRDQEKIKSLTRKKAKKMAGSGSTEMLDIIGVSGGMQQRGRSLINPQTTPDGKGKPSGGMSEKKQIKRSMSTDAGFSAPPVTGFSLPEVVMVFPVLDKDGTAQWDFYLLTEEEVRAGPCS